MLFFCPKFLQCLCVLELKKKKVVVNPLVIIFMVQVAWYVDACTCHGTMELSFSNREGSWFVEVSHPGIFLSRQAEGLFSPHTHMDRGAWGQLAGLWTKCFSDAENSCQLSKQNGVTPSQCPAVPCLREKQKTDKRSQLAYLNRAWVSPVFPHFLKCGLVARLVVSVWATPVRAKEDWCLVFNSWLWGSD